MLAYAVETAFFHREGARSHVDIAIVAANCWPDFTFVNISSSETVWVGSRLVEVYEEPRVVDLSVREEFSEAWSLVEVDLRRVSGYSSSNAR